MKLTVLSRFRDITITDRFVYYNPGDVVDFEDKARIDSLIQRGLAKVAETYKEPKKEEKIETLDTVDIYQPAAKIKEQIKDFTNVAELERVLADEQKAEKPRKGVISMIEERLGELR